LAGDGTVMVTTEAGDPWGGGGPMGSAGDRTTVVTVDSGGASNEPKRGLGE
jgi:hypothetical protein